MAALLGTAVLTTWSRPAGCAPADPPPAVRHGPAEAPGGPRSDDSGAPNHRAVEGGPQTDGALGSGRPRGNGRADRPGVPPGTVGVPVRLAEPTALALVTTGDRVELLTVGESGAPAARVAADALVLGVTGADDPTSGGLLLALTPDEAKRTVGAPERARFAVLLRPAP